MRVLGLAPEEVWRRRPQRIVEFELMLAEEGTTVLKCFLHVSAKEQRERFAERLADPAKHWKHNPKDEETSRRFGTFTAAYEEGLTATSTEWAPWYVIPADRNWVQSVCPLSWGTRLGEPQARRFQHIGAEENPVDAKRDSPYRCTRCHPRRLRRLRRRGHRGDGG